MLVAVDKFTKLVEAAPVTTQDYGGNQFHQVNSFSLWSTTQYHHKQWDKLHIKGVQKLL
jgi:hypothetical protein